MREKIYIADIDTQPIPNSGGQKEKYVSKMTVVTNDLLNVGQNTYWQAQATNIRLSYSVFLRRDLYSNEKYIYSCNKLYEVVNIGKAKDERDLILNMKDIVNTEIESAIKKWIVENEKKII